VHKHLEHVYRKLGATNRASLIAILYRTGVVPDWRTAGGAGTDALTPPGRPGCPDRP